MVPTLSTRLCRRRSGAVILSAALFLIPLLQLACTPASAAPAGVHAERAILNRALHAWAGFPVRSSPRPLILLQGYVLAPEYGFSDDNSSNAFWNGDITPPASWPAAPASSMGLPIIGALAAFKELRKMTTSSHPVGTPPPLSTTGVDLGTGRFLTDRGYRNLPAWLFSLSGVQSPAKVLAVGTSAVYSPPVTRPAQMSATVDPGGRHMVVNFAGARAGTGPCTASYSVAVEESETAVAVDVIQHAHGSPHVICTLVGHSRYASAELATPLGARVVVDASTGGAASVSYAPARRAEGG